MAYHDFGRNRCGGLITEWVLIIAQTSVETLPHAPECARRPTSGKGSLNAVFFLAVIPCSLYTRSGRLPVALSALPHAVHRRKDHACNGALRIGKTPGGVPSEGLSKAVFSPGSIVSCQHQYLFKQLVAFFGGMPALCLAGRFGCGNGQSGILPQLFFGGKPMRSLNDRHHRGRHNQSHTGD